MANKLQLTIYYDLISPYTWPVIQQVTRWKDRVCVNFKPIQATKIAAGGRWKAPTATAIQKDLKFINTLFGVNLNLPHDYVEMVVNGKTEDVQTLLANVCNTSPSTIFPNLNSRLLEVMWLEGGNVVSEIEKITAEFDLPTHTINDTLAIALNNASALHHKITNIPMCILDCPRNRTYSYTNFDSLILLDKEITLQQAKLNTRLCNL